MNIIDAKEWNNNGKRAPNKRPRSFERCSFVRQRKRWKTYILAKDDVIGEGLGSGCDWTHVLTHGTELRVF